MTCDDECISRHCGVCRQHLDAGELTSCWGCVAKARRDLIAIADMFALLPDHAFHAATNGHMVASEPLLGGDALVALSRGSEGLSEDGGTNSGDAEPPAWVLGWWAAVWREALGLDSKPSVWRRPPDLVFAEANAFLGEHLDWAAHYHGGFRQFARDLATTRRQLEGLLRAGDAPLLGVACFECTATLERVYRAPRGCPCPPKAGVPVGDHPAWEVSHAGHDQGGLHDPAHDAGWSCPVCRREYSAGEYGLALAAAYDSCAEWRSQRDATRLTGVPRGTVQTWASRGRIRRRKDSGRVLYSLLDIRERLAENLPDDAA